jgi:hypothetical protein
MEDKAVDSVKHGVIFPQCWLSVKSDVENPVPGAGV